MDRFVVFPWRMGEDLKRYGLEILGEFQSLNCAKPRTKTKNRPSFCARKVWTWISRDLNISVEVTGADLIV